MGRMDIDGWTWIDGCGWIIWIDGYGWMDMMDRHEWIDWNGWI